MHQRMPATIRAYDPADYGQVRALVESVLVEYGFGRTLDSVDRDLREIALRYAAPRGGFWVADDGGVVVGTVAVRPKEERVCELKRLYLLPGRRGAGLGQALYQHAETFARAAGYAMIWLDSSRRFTLAHRLYERNGFVLREQLANEWEDNVYEKALG